MFRVWGKYLQGILSVCDYVIAPKATLEVGAIT